MRSQSSPDAMYKSLQRRPWICAGCLRKQQGQQLGLAGLAAAQRTDPDISLASRGSPSTAEEDYSLRKIFDSRPFWREFSANSSRSVSGKTAGLLHNRYLKSPQGFADFTKDALETSKRIVAKILAASSVEDYRALVRNFDRLSDQLCRVIDLVDFIRNVHPSPNIQHAASFAHSRMYEYMNVLNTTPGLNTQLQKAASMPEVTSQWTREEEITAQILLKDFAQSAISESEATRERFVKLSNEVVQIGDSMMDKMAPEHETLKFPSSKLQGMDPTVVKKLTSWGTSTLPTYGRYARLALRTVHDPEVRRQLYMAGRTSDGPSIRRVERLVQARAELAHLSNHDSFAHMTLTDKMAQTPEAVSTFLEALAANNKALVQADLDQLLAIKAKDTPPTQSPHQINAWDRDYYTQRFRNIAIQAANRPGGAADTLSSYLSLGTVMQGLSRLFSRLYGIHLVPNAPQPGETWHDDVRRLDVIDERDGHIAVVYCDLFERPNKSPNPAHFTLRCSREIADSEIAEARESSLLPYSPTLTDLSNALNDGMALNYSTTPSAKTGKPTLHQLPTIGFICDFPVPSSPHQPTLLSLSSLTTLYHELGHCLHSICGRTSLQNVAGTRCATDFAELPSILMEHFASDPAVLGLYARHWETDEPLDAARVGEAIRREAICRASADTETQILLSQLDQSLHGPGVPGLSSESKNLHRHSGEGEDGASQARWSSTSVYQSVYNSPHLSTVPEPQGTAWHGFFGHLYQYGGVYYSYLFDRAIAGRIWRACFEDGRDGMSLSRDRGERYKGEVLGWGGARGGWECVAGVLGGDRGEWGWMKGGGKRAMEEVGRWGAGGLGRGGGLH